MAETTLSDRALIRLSGEDVRDFLQGLVTQNVDAAITTAQQQGKPNQELLGILSELDEQAHRGGDIIRALRGFVRKDEDLAAPFDFSELLVQTHSLLRHRRRA